VSGCLR